MLNIDYDDPELDERHEHAPDLRPAQGCVWLSVASAVLWGAFLYFIFC